MRYEIDENNFAIKLFDDVNEEPCLYQPNYPNFDKFDSVEEATQWAIAALAAYDPKVLVLPPIGKNIAGELKQIPEDKATEEVK